MDTKELVQEIDQLSLDKKIFIMEKILKSIRREEVSSSMRKAAEELRSDYLNDPELTAFTALDSEDFYEAK
jgi:hypothetical protein